MSDIDPTWPPTGSPKDPADGRANFEAAKVAVEAGVITDATTAISVNFAKFNDPTFSKKREFIRILCTAATAITATLENDVPVGKTVELVAYHATADITAQAGTGATLVKPSSASLVTTQQYEAMVFTVDTNSGTNAAWRLVARS